MVIVMFAVFIGFLVLIAWGGRYLSNVTTQVSVVNPEPGVHCALASTGDGAAISCYPETWVRK